MSILNTLVNKSIIKRSDVSSIEETAKKSGESIEQVLLKRGVSQKDIESVFDGGENIPKRKLGSAQIPGSVLSLIPGESAKYYRVVPLAVKDGVLEVGTTNHDNIEARDALNFISSKSGFPYKLFLISDEDFKNVLGMYQGLTGEVSEALDEFSTQSPIGGDKEFDHPEGISGDAEEKIDATSNKITEEAPVTKIISTILRYAAEGDASDVHIEPMRENVRVRFRVDGVLYTSLLLPKVIHSALVARVKILSNMRLDEKRKPQDGRFSETVEGQLIDFRVSTFPTYFGEKVVMRILNQEKGVKKLDDVGLSPHNLDLIKKALKAPYGLVLISGPTGSGKTTTLYSMLNEVDKTDKNVLSLEDPVEYNIEGVSQSQVRPEIGYTFANGLRTTLRQDPDIIMVGEIRDKETAQLAIQAALTGHLVFSTIHTNNAFGVIPRLIDMGVDPYLIAPTLVLAMAQRLASALCPGAGKEIPVEGSIKIMIEKQFADLPEKYRKEIVFGDKVYEAAPAPNCPKGIRGRIAVMEVLPMDKDIEAVILKNPTELEITKVARSKGMLTMREDAILKAFRREIPFEEINNY